MVRGGCRGPRSEPNPSQAPCQASPRTTHKATRPLLGGEGDRQEAGSWDPPSSSEQGGCQLSKDQVRLGALDQGGAEHARPSASLMPKGSTLCLPARASAQHLPSPLLPPVAPSHPSFQAKRASSSFLPLLPLLLSLHSTQLPLSISHQASSPTPCPVLLFPWTSSPLPAPQPSSPPHSCTLQPSPYLQS